MKTFVTFGEIMLRLSPPPFYRIIHTRSFDVTFGGAEANVAVSLAQFGLPVEFVTRLPKNDVADLCVNSLRSVGVGTNHIVRGGDRLYGWSGLQADSGARHCSALWVQNPAGHMVRSECGRRREGYYRQARNPSAHDAAIVARIVNS